MLSSVASRLFWLARYLERVEGTARIINAYSQLVLDVPKGSELGWGTLISTIDADKPFASHYRNLNERNVLKFMIADKDNLSSLRCSVKAARENVRTTRDVLPREVWELVNEMYLFIEDNVEQSILRRNRFDFLEFLMAECQQMQGLIYTTLSRDHSFTFLKIGSLLERADMTTRVVDVAAGAILDKRESSSSFEPFLWSNVLLSLSASSAYRRDIGPIVDDESTVDFVFKCSTFPRSVIYCINGLQTAVSSINNSDEVMAVINPLEQMIEEFSAGDVSYLQLHTFIDNFQEKLFFLNKVIEEAWFTPQS